MSQKAFQEESESLRAHVVALHAFSTVSARASMYAMEMANVAFSDIGHLLAEWHMESREAVDEATAAEDALDACEAEDEADCSLEASALATGFERVQRAEEGLVATMCSLTNVRNEVLAYHHHLSVFRPWLEEESRSARWAILKGMIGFTSGRAHESDDPEDEECDEEEPYTPEYVRVSLPKLSEVPHCDSIAEAVDRLEETICPALREARKQFELSWRMARVDWPQGGAESYRANHYSELERASLGLERVLEQLTEGLNSAMQDLPE